MKRILCLDGGGAKGLISATVLASIVENVKRAIHEEFDLIVASSVGTVEGGLLSTGVVSAATLKQTMYDEVSTIFHKKIRIPFIQSKYSRKPLESLLNAYLLNMRMKLCKTKFMSTSVNLVDGRTHFFKSWEDKDGQLFLTDAILRSAAAPYYFGTIVDNETQSVWMDGGCGNMNAPMMEGFIEAMRQNWLGNERVHILSIGCGQSNPGVPFKKAKKFGGFRQVYYYADVPDGGLAHIQMANTQAMWLTDFAAKSSNFTFQRVEKYDLPKKLDIMDGIKYRDTYVSIGEELAKQVDYTYLA